MYNKSSVDLFYCWYSDSLMLECCCRLIKHLSISKSMESTWLEMLLLKLANDFWLLGSLSHLLFSR